MHKRIIRVEFQDAFVFGDGFIQTTQFQIVVNRRLIAISSEKCARRLESSTPDGKPNDNYMTFVAAHVDWGMKAEIEQFRREINTREKAREYISKHLPQ